MSSRLPSSRQEKNILGGRLCVHRYVWRQALLSCKGSPARIMFYHQLCQTRVGEMRHRIPKSAMDNWSPNRDSRIVVTRPLQSFSSLSARNIALGDGRIFILVQCHPSGCRLWLEALLRSPREFSRIADNDEPHIGGASGRSRNASRKVLMEIALYDHS